MAEGPRFRREAAPASGPSLLGLVALLGIVAMAAFTRPLWMPTVPRGTLVEVSGEVPRPGTYLVDPASVERALEAAGVEGADDPRVVPAGWRVVVGPAGTSIQQPSDPLLVGLPVDLNACDADALAAVPSLGRGVAERIVADRIANGPFYTLEDVLRVRGVGRGALEILEPFVTLGDPGERPPPAPIDVNTASAAELERLPGIGPVTASRIVVYREEHGAFREVRDLDRVRGIGPDTLAKITPLVTVQ